MAVLSSEMNDGREPEIGYRETSMEHSYNTGFATHFSIGVGVFPILNLRESSLFYWGFRIGSQRFRVEPYDYSSESKGRGFYLSACLGAEFFLDPHVSIGSELQMRHCSLRIEHLAWEKPIEKRRDTSTIALIFVRLYP